MKQKFFELAASEIKNIQTEDSKIWDEINKLKAEFEREVKNKKPIDHKPTVHDPKKTAQCLKLFKTGSKLKWITHVYPNSEGDVFDYNRITKNALLEFQEISKFLPSKVAAFIAVFLKKPQKSKTDKIFYLGDGYETWWSDKIVNWCKAHPGIHPDTDDQLSKTIITPFKKSVEIRDGTDLIEAIKYRLEKTYQNEIFSELNIDFSGVKRSTRFFTGVDQLMTGVSALFAPIKKRSSISNKVLISCSIEEINDQFVNVLEIRHINSYCEKEYDPSVLLNGDMLTAKQEFHSLCDWYVSAKFLNGTFGIYMLDSTGTATSGAVDEVTTDFVHKLIFY
jgi:UDP-2,3-diacylglucosamine pyrophosphatase LpxH